MTAEQKQRPLIDQPASTQGPEAPDLVDRVMAYLADLVPEIQNADPSRRSEIEDALRGELGGSEAYVRSARSKKSRDTALEILRHFNGRNANEVARKLRIGRATVYRVIKTAGTK